MRRRCIALAVKDESTKAFPKRMLLFERGTGDPSEGGVFCFFFDVGAKTVHGQIKLQAGPQMFGVLMIGGNAQQGAFAVAYDRGTVQMIRLTQHGKEPDRGIIGAEGVPAGLIRIHDFKICAADIPDSDSHSSTPI